MNLTMGEVGSRYTQPDPAGGDVPAHSMVLEWWGAKNLHAFEPGNETTFK